MNYEHIPVLLQEVVSILQPDSGKNFVDATLGGGGYSKAILEKIGNGKLLSIDLDADAVELARSKKLESGIQNWTVVHGNFSHIDKIVENHNFNNIYGIVADLGLSSYQLEYRGMSFKTKEVLDMRFNKQGEHIDAKFVLTNYTGDQLKKIFSEFGEEKFSRQIVRKILQARENRQAIHYTTDLYQVIQDALPKPVKHKADDSARRIFQALRIEVNHELENLEEFLPKAFDLLNSGGRLVAVSFHSLEDRMVKQFFVGKTKGCVCPPEFPQCICGKNPEGKILTKKIITASEAEQNQNPRSKPAKLRALQKI
jgi:16S rRNA (cytosine1402-N4)-methyltransferase